MTTRRPDLVVLALVAVAVAAATLAAPSPEPPATPGGWKAVAASGRVEARLDTAVEWLPIHRGGRLAAASVVRTGPRARATLVRGASIVLLDPQSELVLPSSASDGPSTVFQSSGSVIYHVEGMRETGFRVETPYLVAGVKGTEFLVSIESGRASVSVREGTVEVTAARSGERHEVKAGETLLLREEAESGTVERVDRRGAPLDGASDVSGDAKHLAWKQGRRLDDARREVGYLLDTKALREPETVEARAESVAGDAGLGVDATVEKPLVVDPGDRVDPRPDDEARDELIEDLTNDPLRKDDTSTTHPPPAPNP